MSLMDIPAEFVAIQVIALSSKDALEQFVRDRGLKQMSAARIAVQDKLHYVLLLGIFEHRADAEAALAELPATLKDTTPWIRTMGSLQAAMRAADTLTGSSEF